MDNFDVVMKAHGLTRDSFFNFKNLRPKEQWNYSYEDNFDMLLESIVSMFNFYDFPETVNTRFIPMYALREGMGCVCHFPTIQNDEFVVARFQMCGKPDVNGLGTDAIITTYDGHSEFVSNWKEAENVQPFFLNRIYSPDLHIGKTATYLTEADTSIKAILLLARYSRLLACKDEKTKEAVNAALSNVSGGSIATLVSSNIYDSLRGTAEEPITNIDITDVRNNDMIQYLSKYEDDLLRQFFNIYGLSTSGASKMAEQSTAEINQGSNRAMVIPHMRYECLQEFAEACNSKFGWNCSITFSECWQNEKAKCVEDLPDAEEPTEEPTPSPEEPTPSEEVQDE